MRNAIPNKPYPTATTILLNLVSVPTSPLLTSIASGYPVYGLDWTIPVGVVGVSHVVAGTNLTRQLPRQVVTVVGGRAVHGLAGDPVRVVPGVAGRAEQGGRSTSVAPVSGRIIVCTCENEPAQ